MICHGRRYRLEGGGVQETPSPLSSSDSQLLLSFVRVHYQFPPVQLISWETFRLWDLQRIRKNDDLPRLRKSDSFSLHLYLACSLNNLSFYNFHKHYSDTHTSLLSLHCSKVVSLLCAVFMRVGHILSLTYSAKSFSDSSFCNPSIGCHFQTWLFPSIN